MNKAPSTRVQFDTRKQLEYIKRAAKLKKWSMNRFILEAAMAQANAIIEADTLKPIEMTQQLVNA